jgi:hypothetical protein
MSGAAVAVVRTYVDVIWNQGDVGRLAEFLAPDVVSRGPGDTEVQRGRDRYAIRLVGMLTVLAPMRTRIVRIACDGELVAWQWELSAEVRDPGVLAEPLRTMAAAVPGLRCLRATGMTFSRVVDGLIVEEQTEADPQGVLNQLGGWAA